jgi:hypothetical protein
MSGEQHRPRFPDDEALSLGDVLSQTVDRVTEKYWESVSAKTPKQAADVVLAYVRARQRGESLVVQFRRGTAWYWLEDIRGRNAVLEVPGADFFEVSIDRLRLPKGVKP